MRQQTRGSDPARILPWCRARWRWFPPSPQGSPALPSACSGTHRTVLRQGLDAARVVVLDAAAGATFPVPLALDELLHLPILPDAGGELGSQVDQVNLGGRCQSRGCSMAPAPSLPPAAPGESSAGVGDPQRR